MAEPWQIWIQKFERRRRHKALLKFWAVMIFLLLAVLLICGPLVGLSVIITTTTYALFSALCRAGRRNHMNNELT